MCPAGDTLYIEFWAIMPWHTTKEVVDCRGDTFLCTKAQFHLMGNSHDAVVDGCSLFVVEISSGCKCECSEGSTSFCDETIDTPSRWCVSGILRHRLDISFEIRILPEPYLYIIRCILSRYSELFCMIFVCRWVPVFLFLTGFVELLHDLAIFKQAWMALAAPSLGASFPLPLSHLAR